MQLSILCRVLSYCVHSFISLTALNPPFSNVFVARVVPTYTAVNINSLSVLSGLSLEIMQEKVGFTVICYLEFQVFTEKKIQK